MTDRRGLVIVELTGMQRQSDDETAGRAWWWGTVGPVNALLRSSMTSQPSRDATELDLLEVQWEAAGIPVHRFIFALDTLAPAFWGLTDDARARIEDSWCFEGPNLAALDSLKAYWVREHPALVGTDLAPTGC
jgi:hypothetical protein